MYLLRKFLVYAVVFLLINRVGATIFSGTPFAAWKQLIVVILVGAIFFYWKLVDNISRLVFFTVAWFSTLFIFTSAIFGGGILSVAFNIFFYLSWAVFFVVWKSFSQKLLDQVNIKKMFIFVFILNIVALIVDISGDGLFFLVKTSVDEQSHYYEHHGIAKRTSGLLETSTLVMPVLIMFSVLIMEKINKSIFFIGVGLLIAAYATGSSMAFFSCGLFLFLCVFVCDFSNLPKYFLGVTFLAPVIYGVSKNFFDGNQMQRVFDNFYSDSDSNIGRSIAWNMGIEIIKNMDLINLFFGYGLGSTNSEYPSRLFFTHGESSYIQSIIEGGMVGFILRLLPYVLLLYYLLSNPKIIKSKFTAAIISVAPAIAVAPIFGSIVFQAMLGICLAGAIDDEF